MLEEKIAMKFRMMTFVLLVSFYVSARADTITLAQLYSDKAGWNEKTVKLSGVVKGFYQKPGFSSCLLLDQGKAVCLYLKAGTKLANEQKLTVTGPFLLRHDADGQVFRNVILVDQELPTQAKP